MVYVIFVVKLWGKTKQNLEIIPYVCIITIFTVLQYGKIVELTVVSPVCSVCPSLDKRVASPLKLLVYYSSDSFLSGVWGLISKL